MTEDHAKAFAAIVGGVCAIAAVAASSHGYTLAAYIGAGLLIVAGAMLAIQ